MKAYSDGACRIHTGYEASCAFVVYDDAGNEMKAYSEYLGKQTNNYAEYSGLIRLLRWLHSFSYWHVDIYCDSQLIVNQVNGMWNVKHEELKPLWSEAKFYLNMCKHKLHWVRGHNGDKGNERVDQLCNQILDYQKEINGKDNRHEQTVS